MIATAVMTSVTLPTGEENAIRAFPTGVYTMAEIANYCGVHYSTVSRAVRWLETDGDFPAAPQPLVGCLIARSDPDFSDFSGLVNRMGAGFTFRVWEETGATYPGIARAYTAARGNSAVSRIMLGVQG